MKIFKGIIALILSLLIFSVLAVNVCGIGFDAEETYNSVFVINSGNALGSGFTIGKNCIITNAHVIVDSSDVKVMTYDNKKYDATVVAMNEDMDIAVLVVSDVEFPYLPVEDYNNIKIGSDVYAIGAPNGMTYTLTKGTLSAKDRQIGDYTYLQLDAALNEGNSGGPLLTDDGRVIGVNSMKRMDSEGIGLAIPMNTVVEYLISVDIEVDEQGNVVGILSDDKKESFGDSNGGSDKNEGEQDSNGAEGDADAPDVKIVVEEEPINYILIIALSISALLNIIFIVILIINGRANKKNKPQKLDKSDRTDFEIDILE